MKKKIPISSYRLELSSHFGFKEAIQLIPYLKDLGVEMVYTSPCFETVKDSNNSYMITSTLTIEKKLGGQLQFEKFCKSLKYHGLMYMMDIVPNHMAANKQNPWWDDVIKNLQSSKYSPFFDIDYKQGKGKIITSDCLGNIHAKINYRRFFDITEMVGINIENNDLYDLYFSKIFTYVKKGWVDGFRIDHIDGLKFPKKFLEKIHRDCPDLYIALEKILTPGELIRKNFICDGSVGYDVLNLINQVMLDGSKKEKIDQLYKKVEEEIIDLAKIKINYLNCYLISEIDRFSKAFKVEKSELLLFLAHFPIYRSYVDEVLEKVDEKAIKFASSFTKGTFFKKEVVKQVHRDTLLKLQQIMPAVFAKGVEDTLNYRYLRLSSLNEVGADLSEFSISNETFHKRMINLFNHFPNTMHTLSTHDTKRSLDARMRIHVLAEMVDEFENHLFLLPEFKSPRMRYFFFQTWIAISEDNQKERLTSYMIKASCEGKYYSDHLKRNTVFEKEMIGWIEKIYDDEALIKKITIFKEKVIDAAEMKSIACLVLQMGLFGVMDIYQGEELINANLVDPDNRRVVDFSLRKQSLKDQSSLKMNILTKGLHFRKTHKELILHGSYEPIETKPHQLGYKRCYKNKELTVIINKYLKDPIIIEDNNSIFSKKLPIYFALKVKN